MLVVPALPDSALRIARHALGEIAGTPQLPRVRSDLTTVSTHYSRDRNGGGRTEVAVMIGIGRAVVDSTLPATLVELRAWALDLPHQLTTAQRRAGVPMTAVTTNAPAIRTPRAVTVRDTVDAANIEYVLGGLLRSGARRLP